MDQGTEEEEVEEMEVQEEQVEEMEVQQEPQQQQQQHPEQQLQQLHVHRRQERGPLVNAGHGCTVNISNSSNVGISAHNVDRQGRLIIDALLSVTKDLKRTFVEVESTVKAREILERYGHVTLTGAPGEGKTATTMMFCDQYRTQKYDIIFVTDLDKFDVNLCYTVTSNTCFIFDDLFGNIGITTNWSNIEKCLAAVYHSLTQDRQRGNTARRRPNDENVDPKKSTSPPQPREEPIDIKVVFTSKTYNLNKGCDHLYAYNATLFRQATIVEKDINEIIETENPVFGFPYTSKMYFSESNFHKGQGIEFFKEPLWYLITYIDGLVREKSSRSLVLMILALCGGRFNVKSFQENPERAVSKDIMDAVREISPFNTKFDIYNETTNFDGTLIKLVGNVASFSHPSIYDAVTCAMIKSYAILLLEHCSLKFIFERVRLSCMAHEIQKISVDPMTNIVNIPPGYHCQCM